MNKLTLFEGSIQIMMFEYSPKSKKFTVIDQRADMLLVFENCEDFFHGLACWKKYNQFTSCLSGL